MLEEVRIKNLAIIDEIDIKFGKGLNIITGETGAGKSLFLRSLNLISGERANSNFIGKSSSSLYTEAKFVNLSDKVIEDLENMGLNYDDELILSRSIDKKGRSQARVNGRLTTVQEMKNIGNSIIEIHGQNDRFLLQRNKQLELIDSLLDKDVQSILIEYKKLFKRRLELIKYIEKNENDSVDIERKKDILKYQIDEIKDFDIENTNINQLYEEHKRLLNSEELVNQFNNLEYLFSGDENFKGLKNILNSIETIIYDIEIYNSSWNFKEKIIEIKELINILQYELNLGVNSIDINPEQLEILNNKMAAWTEIQRKYGQNKALVMDFYNESRNKLIQLDEIESNIIKAKEEKKLLEKKLIKYANIISNNRKKIAKKIHNDMAEVFNRLLMNEAIFEISFNEVELNINGKDKILFNVKTNRGQEMKALHEIASGGELSRIMLGIRSIFINEFENSTIIFDEIDSGVSGQAAYAMAKFLLELSKSIQIIAVTHLPQIAAMGDRQYLLEKRNLKNQTVTKIKVLNKEERIDEIARLISGNKKTNAAYAQAKKLLNNNYKN